MSVESLIGRLRAGNQLNISARFLSELVVRASGLIVFPLMARGLGPEGYGVYSQLGVINGALIPLAMMGLGFSVVRLVSGKNDPVFVGVRFMTSLILVLGVSSCLAIGVALIAPVLNALFIKIDWADSVIRWSSALIVCSAVLLTLGEYFRARLQIVAQSLFQIAATVAGVVGVAIVLYIGGGVLTVVKVMLATQMIQIAVMFVYFSRSNGLSLRGQLMPRDELMEMVRFGGPIIVMDVGFWLFSMSDRLIIGYYLNMKDAGVYSAACALATIPAALAAPFWYTLYPLMAAHKNNVDQEKIMAVCRKYSRSYFVFGIPALLGLAVLAPDILFVLGSGKFEIHPAIFGIIALGLFSFQFGVIAHYLIGLHNEPHFLRNVILLCGMTNIGLNLILVPPLGIAGVALSTLVSYLLLDIMVFRRVISYGYRFTSLYDVGAIGKIAISTVPMAAAVYLFRVGFVGVSFMELFGAIFLGIAVYALSFFAVNRFSIDRVWEFIGTRGISGRAA